jgi:signal transduction histidine kinase
VRDPEEGLTGHPPVPGTYARIGDRIASYILAMGMERWARLGAVAVVPLFLPRDQVGPFLPLFGVLATYVLLTALARRDHLIRAADLLVAAILIAVTGGQVVPFLLFLIVTVAGPASAGGVRAGLAAGSTLSVVLLATLTWTGELPELGLGGALPAALLLPLAGVTTASAAQVLEDRGAQDRLVLEEANRLLSSLRAIADDIPGGLDVSTVSAAVLAEVRTVEGAEAAIVYTEVHGVLQPTASSGVSPGAIPTLRVDELRAVATPPGEPVRILTPRNLPAPLLDLARGRRHWAALAVGRDGNLVGVLLLAFDDLELARRARSRLGSIAADAALALENARLFDGTRLRAADAARRRIAGDLHDGVAQSLAHVRMELELLAMASDEPDGGEIGRLSRVAGSALEDLRATIGGLRRPLRGDLPALLQAHLDDVRSTSGPELTFAVSGHAVVDDPERAEDLLRVTQEAVSNALRHARAAHVAVTLRLDPAELELTVEDDGIGPDGRSVRPGTGVGLRSMRERAERLDGELEVRERVGGGTVVHLRCPTVRSSKPSLVSDHIRPGR